MHYSRGRMITPAARGLNECYKAVVHIKKNLFVIAAEMPLPASTPLLLKRLHRCRPLGAAHIQRAADNYKYQARFCSPPRLIH